MPNHASKQRAPRNRTLILDEKEIPRLRSSLLRLEAQRAEPVEGIVLGDCADVARLLPPGHVDLLFLDPPYNLKKSFHGARFEKRSVAEYTEWLDQFVTALVPLLKPTASIYICG